MKNFSRNRDSGNKRRGPRDRNQMHDAVCAACGKDCEIPFRPTGDKPVYCSSCFNKDEKFSLAKRSDDGRRREKEFKKMFSAQCASCGDRCEVPFRPTGDKPVYCSFCFEKVNQQDRNYPNKPNREKNEIMKSDIAMINDQLISINRKLEKLLVVLSPQEKSVALKEKEGPSKKDYGNKKEKETLKTKTNNKDKKNTKKKEVKKPLKKVVKKKK